MWNEVFTLMRPNRILLMTTTPVLALSLWLSGCTAEPEGSDNPSTTVSESAQAQKRSDHGIPTGEHHTCPGNR